MIKKITILFSLLTTLICCNNQPTKTSSAVKIYNDTTKPLIKSGFYLVINDTTDVAFRKLNSVTKKDVFNGKTFILSLKNHLPFDIIDSSYIQYSKETKYYEIYFRFDSIGQQKFSNLTNKSSDTKFLTENGYAKLGTVINNTLLQVASIVGPFSGNIITLSGIFDEQTAKELLDQIKKEINQRKH